MKAPLGHLFRGIVSVGLVLAAANLSSNALQVHQSKRMGAESFVRVDTVTIVDGANAPHRVRIFVPRDAKGANVLVLLHGFPGSFTDWSSRGGAPETMSAAMSSGKLPPTILVLPDGNTDQTSDPQWLDSADGSERVASFISETLPEYLIDHYQPRDTPAGWTLGGISSGGYAAVSLGLRSTRYGSVIAFSAYPEPELTDSVGRLLPSDDAYAQAGIAYAAAHSTGVVKSIWIWCGSDDAEYYQKSQEVAGIADSVATTLFVPGQGGHAWGYWSDAFSDSLTWLAQQNGIAK